MDTDTHGLNPTGSKKHETSTDVIQIARHTIYRSETRNIMTVKAALVSLLSVVAAASVAARREEVTEPLAIAWARYQL